MTKLINYLNDGAGHQARAVLMALQGRGNIEASYNYDTHVYDAEVEVGRWENCREQGYIVSLRSKSRARQINIAFFEHRNSDEIHAVKWEQTSISTLSIDSANFGDLYRDKYDTSFKVKPGDYERMAETIHDNLCSFYEGAE